MVRSPAPYQSGTTTACQLVPGSARTLVKVGRRMPLVRGRPIVPGGRGGAGSWSAASSRGRVIAVRLPNSLFPAHGIQELESGKPAVAEQHEVAPRQPAARLQGKLASDVEQRLVPATLLAAGPLGVHQRGQEGQRPDPSGPGDRRQQHQAPPAQPAGIHETAVGGTYRVAVDPLGPDALAAAALDGVVKRHHHGTARRKGVDQQPEQDAAAGVWAPGGAAEHPVKVHEPALARAAGDPQQARYRALLPWGQDGADQQRPGMPPGTLDERRREGRDDLGEAGGQRRHGGVSWRKRCQPTHHASFVTSPILQPTNWPKSS